MDFSFNEEQEMLQKSASEFLENECSKKFVRAMEEDEKGYSPELWKRMAELGWMGLVLPEEYGGMGSNFLTLVSLLEEVGRVLLPGPFVPTVVYSSLPILYYGTEEQKKEFLPKIADGNLIMTLALTEPNERLDEAGVETIATRSNNDYIVSGTKLFVPDAHIADWLLCVAKVDEGITLFLVDAKSPGVNCTLLKTLASDKQCEVILDKVKVPARNILGKPGIGWEVVSRIREWGAVAQCALILGCLQQVLEMTVDYTKERVQFDRPIGSFQAVQHQCVDMLMDIDGVKFTTHEAAWKLSQELPATMEVSMAKAWASDASRKVCLLGHKIQGGVAIMEDHDMQLYFRRAKAMELTFGDGDFHREIVAKELGLR